MSLVKDVMWNESDDVSNKGAAYVVYVAMNVLFVVTAAAFTQWAPMAANLLASGFSLTVHTRSRMAEEPLAAAGAARVRLAVASDGATLASIGGPPRRWRCLGRVVLDIEVPAGTGSRGALALADQALDLFAGWPASGLTFLAGAPGPAVQEGDLYRLTVTVPFRHDDLR